ncbi:sugar-binding transcriptional regulator [Geochorda subterranea]|uniref:Sugar-binding domain-containing protein n=1 Tax=Geochorda subterranea TaxID=3109564 RepID=A0ABZ1BM64_9FIRM|nr:sugar-binding domain-containing protein [Limnochorda sp. LNt]WRP13900.1 sugar-binding domain-containing protein [Limnochorda sp. LNt]
MGQPLSVILKVAPELSEVIERRYIVLRNVAFLQPVGRRGLAARLHWPERMVRNEVDFLRHQGFLDLAADGMRVSEAGQRLLNDLKDLVRELRGLADVEQRLARRLGLQRVIVVPGDADVDDTSKKEIARATARFLKEVLREGQVLAVTGGSTLAEVALSLPEESVPLGITVVPGRGGLGEDVELQANTIAAEIARRLRANYRLLHVPDDLPEEAVETVASQPQVREILDLIRRADIVLHGVGTAEEMARRRRLGPAETARLRERGAVGEAFGYYFNRQGQPVYQTASFGLRVEDLAHCGQVVVVGGGRSKAEAALAVISTGYQDVLITDEGLAWRVLELTEGPRSEEMAAATSASR